MLTTSDRPFHAIFSGQYFLLTYAHFRYDNKAIPPGADTKTPWKTGLCHTSAPDVTPLRSLSCVE